MVGAALAAITLSREIFAAEAAPTILATDRGSWALSIKQDQLLYSHEQIRSVFLVRQGHAQAFRHFFIRFNNTAQVLTKTVFVEFLACLCIP